MSDSQDQPLPNLPGKSGKSELLDALKESVQEVFNSMVFNSTEATVRQVSGSDGADIKVVSEDDTEAIEVEEVVDALGECVNMVTDVVKTKALDPLGEFHVSTPEVIQSVATIDGDYCGTLAYRLTQGVVSLEIWLDGIED